MLNALPQASLDANERSGKCGGRAPQSSRRAVVSMRFFWTFWDEFPNMDGLLMFIVFIVIVQNPTQMDVSRLKWSSMTWMIWGTPMTWESFI